MLSTSLYPSRDELYLGHVTLWEFDHWPDALLYAGKVTRADLDECEAAHSPAGQAPKPDLDDLYAEEPLKPLKYLGEQRKWRDVRCRCERPLQQIEWYGHDEPLAAWCAKCGRVMPPPYDARYPLSPEDRQKARPTVEVGIVAEVV